MDDSYETVEEDLVRLNFDNSSKIKLKLNRIKKSKSQKVSLLTSEIIDEFNTLINDEILPQIALHEIPLTPEEDLSKLFTFQGCAHKVDCKQETGTNLYFDLEEMQFLGCGEKMLDVRNKLYFRKNKLIYKRERGNGKVGDLFLKKKRRLVQTKSRSIKNLRKIERQQVKEGYIE